MIATATPLVRCGIGACTEEAYGYPLHVTGTTRDDRSVEAEVIPCWGHAAVLGLMAGEGVTR